MPGGTFSYLYRMDILELRQYCLEELPFTDEATPFDETTLVYRVKGKMYALCDMVDSGWVNLKCDPDRAIELRERYPDWIRPGWHMHKAHWNTVSTAGDLPDAFLREMIRESYMLVVGKLPRVVRGEVLAAVEDRHP